MKYHMANEAEVHAIKAQVEAGHPVTVTFTTEGTIGVLALHGVLMHLIGRHDVTIRLDQRKALSDRGYPEPLLSMDDPVREVMLANPEVDYRAAVRLAYPDR